MLGIYKKKVRHERIILYEPTIRAKLFNLKITGTLYSIITRLTRVRVFACDSIELNGIGENPTKYFAPVICASI